MVLCLGWDSDPKGLITIRCYETIEWSYLCRRDPRLPPGCGLLLKADAGGTTRNVALPRAMWHCHKVERIHAPNGLENSIFSDVCIRNVITLAISEAYLTPEIYKHGLCLVPYYKRALCYTLYNCV